MINRQLLYKGNVYKQRAIESLIYAKNDFGKTKTMSFRLLRDYGYKDEELKILEEIILKERFKPLINRNSSSVTRDFEARIREMKNAKNESTSKSQEARGKKQKIQLGLAVDVRAYWPNIEAGGKLYYILCSMNQKELPDPQKLFSMRHESKNLANVIVAMKIDDASKISRCVIAIQGVSRTESSSIIRALYKSFNNGNGERWIKDDYRMTLSCIAGDSIKYEQVIQKVQNGIRSIYEN